MGIVLPDGILGNPNTEFVRAWILQNCEVLASVDLPVETFLPRTGTQTSVLILRRKSAEEKLTEGLAGQIADSPIFMAIAHKVGKDRRANVIYKRDADGTEIRRRDLYPEARRGTVVDFIPQVEPDGRVVDDDLPRVAQLFHEFLAKKESGALQHDR